ncbi:hypothetical protein RM555_23715 [Micromonospora sp. DSM 115977]|uniref:Methylamine utilization protein MauE n=1 Tax=Micromonospora reichwaldensis TaxID=3075516 RepID=A0ABU2X1J1_9ACTN|nr:hypothetical protein [Micromonospora sp. DSM 115977]MDT0532007.1 hypothetical protein [Micromonospora sp. DSM 115977]
MAAAELATAVLAATLPVRPAALLVAFAYLTLTVVAYRLRGQTCACFGSAAMVGRWHIAANLTAGLLSAAAAALVPPDRLSAPWRLAVTAAAAVCTVIVVRTLDRRAATTAGSADCDRPPAMVELVVSDTCPSCRSLKQLLAQMEPARRNAVVTLVVNRGEKLPYGMTSVPAAQALDVDGRPICAPVDGIGAVKALIDTIRLGSPVGGHADR